ncbi:hypothetical protein [Mycobacterium tilburgii]|nr:hypothetical protein [Mycobacterium tilburgii]
MHFNPTGVAAILLGYVVSLVATTHTQAAFLSGCLDLADGRPVSIGSLL